MKPTGTIQIIEVTARLIRDSRSEITQINTNDPLKLITSQEDIISFPSLKCTLHTTRVDDISSGKYELVILISGKNDERYYVFHLQKGEDGVGKCICYESLTDWDKDAKLVVN